MNQTTPEAARAKPAPPADWGIGLIVFAVGAVVLAYLCARVQDWAVMTDELLYERLAISIADGGVPRVHGEVTDVLAVLYPLVIAPVLAFVSMPEAISVVHGVNGILFASAAVPVFLLARELRLSRFACVAASVFAVALPWTVIGGFVMTEAAAYPAAMWALLAVQRAVVVPSPRRDAVAVAAVAVAALARPQLAALGIVLVAAAVVHELRFGRWRDHVVASAVAALALVVVLLGGSGLLGSYAPALEEGALVSWDALRSAVVHLDVTAVAVGIVPLILGLGWAVGALVRPPEPDRLAFAAIAVASVVVLALESGSVVERFGLGLDVKDRYFFYAAPVLFLATACALDDPRPRVAGVLAVTVFFVATVGLEDFEPVFGVNIDSPASSTHEALTRWGNESGIKPADFLAIAAGLIAVALFFALRRAPREPLAFVVLGGVVAFALAETAYTWDRLLSSSGPSARPLTTAPPPQLSWVDAADPQGTVGMLAYSVAQDWYPSAVAWWDVEFWNASVSHAYVLGPYFTYTPESFRRTRLGIDPRTGVLAGADVDYLVRTTLDARFGPAGIVAAVVPDMELVDLEVPLRAAWMSYGLDPDGWTRPERRSVIRVFPPAGLTVLQLTVSAPDVEGTRRVRVGEITVELASNQDSELPVEVCVPDGGYADVPIVVDGSTAVRAIPLAPPFSERFRNVGVRISQVRTTATGRSCRT